MPLSLHTNITIYVMNRSAMARSKVVSWYGKSIRGQVLDWLRRRNVLSVFEYEVDYERSPDPLSCYGMHRDYIDIRNSFVLGVAQYASLAQY